MRGYAVGVASGVRGSCSDSYQEMASAKSSPTAIKSSNTAFTSISSSISSLYWMLASSTPNRSKTLSQLSGEGGVVGDEAAQFAPDDHPKDRPPAGERQGGGDGLQPAAQGRIKQ